MTVMFLSDSVTHGVWCLGQNTGELGVSEPDWKIWFDYYSNIAFRQLLYLKPLKGTVCKQNHELIADGKKAHIECSFL